jgi:hypothetical protein
MDKYPYKIRKTYVADWVDELEPVQFYATDDEMAIWYLGQHYNSMPEYLSERVIEYREIKVK